MRTALKASETAAVSVEIADELSPADLNDLCDAADAAIEQGGGFGWVKPPAREVLERYWRGVLAVPERHLLLARLDGEICGALQVIEPNRNNEAQAFCANIVAAFVAPYARGLGAGRKLMQTAEQLASEMGYKALQLDVRETQETAIALTEKLGYTRWGVNPVYAHVNGDVVRGYYYSKALDPKFAAP
jgi:ribosomal protein S18 acetylase RimI-like enzyme